MKRLQPWQIYLGLGVAAAFGLLALHGVNKVFLDDGDFLAIDGERSIGTFFSGGTFFLAGALCIWAAVDDTQRRGWWALAGLMFLAFGVDDLAQVHESTEESANNLSRLVLQPLVAGTGCAILVSLGRRLEGPASALAKASGFLLVLGVLCSLFNTYLHPPHLIYVPVMYVEELSEILMGVCLVAAALARPRATAAAHRRAGVASPSASASSS
jgi:hypothetical protein